MFKILEMIAEWRKGCSNAGPAYDHMMQHPEGTSSPVECTECTVGLINAIEMHANQSKYTVNINPELISCILNLIEASKPGADRTKSTEITVKLGDLDTLLWHFFWQDRELRRLNPPIPTDQKG